MTRAPTTGFLRFILIGTLFGIALAATLPLDAHSPQLPQIDGPTPAESLPAAPGDDEPDATRNASPENQTIFREKGLNLLNLLSRGGWFMLPLGLLSIVVVALGIERALALRQDKIMPHPFVRDLGAIARDPSGFDPRLAFRACQVYPSAASRVIRVMLLKAGRPQSEIEHAVAEAAQREATRLQAPATWLTLAATVAPLIGLLGTVWGMIQAFYDTTQLVAGQNKAEVLASGIYTALVTTLCGLVIAIPAAVLAHWFENRIVAVFHRIEEMAAGLTPLLESWEGRLRAGANPESVSETPAGRDEEAIAPARPRQSAPR